MKESRLVSILAALTSASLFITACSGADTAQMNADADRQAAGPEEVEALRVTGKPKLPDKIPKNPFAAFNTYFEGVEFIEGIAKCFGEVGCFGDEGAARINEKLEEISDQLTEIKAEVAEGFATTNLNIAESNYASAERDYNIRYGSHIPDATRLLQRVTDPKLSAAARKAATRDFEREAKVLMPASAESAMRDYLTTLAGSGRSLTQGGLLGAAWKLIASGERQAQGDPSAEEPLFLSASSVNLMVDIGTEHLTEGAQLAGILAAYTVLIDREDFEQDPEYQELLRSQLVSLWTNGVDGVPGAAAIAASLPRPLTSQSGVFTTGFGLSKSEGLIVRNFGRIADPENKTGPLINGDTGYALTPAFDAWLYETKKFGGGARRELAISRSAVDWQYDKASKTLTTSVTQDTKMPHVFDRSEFASEYGSLEAVHPSTDAGAVVSFAQVGTSPAEQTQWEIDLRRQVINPAGRPDLCLGYTTRWEFKAWPGVPGVDGLWSNSYNAIGTLFDNKSVFDIEFEDESGNAWRLPRVSLRTCERNAEMEWFLEGPIPQDNLPFWDINSLVALSGTNVQAIEEDGYPINFWRNLSLTEAEAIRSVTLGRGIPPDRLFRLYGSTQTVGTNRSLPPILHPALWVGVPGGQDAGANRPAVPKGQYFSVADYKFTWTAASFPVLDDGKQTFYFIGSNGTYAGAVNASWITTSPTLGIDVEACTFLFQLPQGDNFECSYKSDVFNELRVPSVRISVNSPLLLTADSAREGESPSPSASPSLTPCEDEAPSPSGDESPAPCESGSPSPSASGSPSPSESGSPSPSASGSPSPSESGSPSPSASGSPSPNSSPSPSASPATSSDDSD